MTQGDLPVPMDPAMDTHGPEEQSQLADRRRARREEQRQLRSIVEHLADGVVIVGAGGVIRFANPAAEQLFGRPREALVGTELGFPLTAGDAAPIDVVRPGSDSIAAELRVVDLSWDGEPARLVSVRDVTERRRAEERTRQLEAERVARAEAEAANRAKSELLATMSHELRTPLNAVIGYSELLDLDLGGALSAEQRHHIRRIRGSAQHLLGLVDQLLDLARIDAGRLALDIASVPARTTAEAAAALVQPLAEARGVVLVEERPRDAAAYEGDEDRVRQILVNLLTNAVKFTGPGGRVTVQCGETPTPEADARLRGDGPWTCFRVGDTGIGIPPDQLARIFQPFVQAESGHTRAKDGTGLGLTISRRLARLMDGDVTVRSAPGAGSTFTLWLPSSSAASRLPPPGPKPETVPRRVRGLAEIGESLLRELEPLLEAFVAGVRAQCPAPGAATLRFSQVADHIASYVADLAGMLIVLDETDGHPSPLLTDAAEIHRLVATRHGAQRAGLGWNRSAIRCEYDILRAQIERVVRQRTHSVETAAMDEALAVMLRFLAQAEEISVRALVHASGRALGPANFSEPQPDALPEGPEAPQALPPE